MISTVLDRVQNRHWNVSDTRCVESATHHISAVRPILDHTGHYWVKGADTRGILEELQADRENGTLNL